MSGARILRGISIGGRSRENEFSGLGRIGTGRTKRVLCLAAWIFVACGSYATAFQDGTGGMDPDPPIAYDDWVETVYDVPVYCEVLFNDAEMLLPIDPDSITIVTPPAYGDVEVISGDVIYMPDPGYVGIDAFEYTVSDTDGNGSNVAAVYIDVYNDPPMITEFTITEGPDHYWFFEGFVEDENVSTVIITFGGLLEGESTTVNSDGSFEFIKRLNDGESGPVTAVATDEVGAESEEAYDEVLPP